MKVNDDVRFELARRRSHRRPKISIKDLYAIVNKMAEDLPSNNTGDGK